ncbi:MAG TPA: NmrA family NAD(P)-binding protein [Caulobacteraceae bacterium]|nr:NmrA family NAD(P)-binding protein [Caulobacteraceae bacterium]
MSGPGSTVLAIGASGRFAGLIVPELARRGVRVRAFLRDAGKADAARANGAVEIAIGDLRDPESVRAAMEAVEGVFYIGPAFAEEETAFGLRAVAAAEGSGVRRFVFSSVMHPAVPLAHHGAKLPVEAALQGSRLAYTILQPAMFFQNFAPDWPRIIGGGRFGAPYSKGARIGLVDYRDVAEVAAIALTEDGLGCGSFELCGEPALDRHAIAQIISEVSGVPIEAAEQTPGQWLETTTPRATDRVKKLLADMFAYYDLHGFAGNSLALGAILGREPRRLRAYIGELESRRRQAA